MNGLKTGVIGGQMLFVAFGALVLVPLLTGLDPSLALFAAGIGTLAFHGITKGMVPIFLGSSFAFISPIQEGIKTYGLSATLGALACTSVVYFILSGCFKLWGWNFLKRVFPPVVIGPVVMVIGLKLAPVATASSISFNAGSFETLAIVAAAISLGTAILVSVCGKNLLKLVPVLMGVFAGYIFCLIIGKVNFAPVFEANWFSVPWIAAKEAGKFASPSFNLAAVLFMLPVALAPAVEHVGDILAISSVTGKNYVENPGLSRTFLGDGVAVLLGPLAGGPSVTTYSEVTGAVALTKAYNPQYMRIAAVLAIILAFCGKLNALLASIPAPVMGGIMMLLFGMIAVVGIKTLMDHKVDLTLPRNMIIIAVILVSGIGDLRLEFGESFILSGIGLAGIVGILLNLVIPSAKEVN